VLVEITYAGDAPLLRNAQLALETVPRTGAVPASSLIDKEPVERGHAVASVGLVGHEEVRKGVAIGIDERVVRPLDVEFVVFGRDPAVGPRGAEDVLQPIAVHVCGVAAVAILPGERPLVGLRKVLVA